ncbi:MAG: PQQ-dependent sugar dehydrogenase [Mycobacteriales bacterium]
MPPSPSRLLGGLLCVLLVQACASSGLPASADLPTPPGTAAIDTSRVEVLATGLAAPWGLAFLPDGDALVTERDSKRVLRVPAAGGPAVEVRRITEAAPRGEGGLLGIAISPTYATDGFVYVYVTTATDNRVVRFTLDGPVESVLTGIPRGAIHNGGRITFGPDGQLYIGTGDTGNKALAQDDDSLGGKILRLVPGAEVEVFSKGHRNVQGLAFDSRGRLWATEFGQNTYDEVNLVSAGDNGGWPIVEGKGTGGGRFAEPFLTWRPEEASPSGAAIVGDDLWVAALRGKRLWRVPLSGTTPTPLLVGEYGRLRAAGKAPDGSLWLLTSNRDGRGEPLPTDDRILRLPPRNTPAAAPSATMSP